MDCSLELFEVQFLLGSMACDADIGPLGGSGFVGVGRDVSGTDITISDLVNHETPPIDISPERVRIHSGSPTFSERYARMATDLALVEPNSDELTPLGEAVATAYEDAIDISFDTFIEQARDQTVSGSFLTAFSGSGCACSLSAAEIQLFRRLFFGLSELSRTGNDQTLTFTETPPSHPADLEPVFERYRRATTDVGVDSVLDVVAVQGDVEFDTEVTSALVSRFAEGQPIFARGSLLFVLGLGAQHNADRDMPVMGDLDQIADVWALHNLARRFVGVNEQLLELLIEVVRLLEPATPQDVARTVVSTDAFTQTFAAVPADVTITLPDSDTQTTGLQPLWQAATYGEWFLTQPTVSLEPAGDAIHNEASEAVLSWTDIRTRLERGNDQPRFSLDKRAPWALFHLFDTAVDRATSAAQTGDNRSALAAAGEAVSLAAQLFARWQTWHDTYLATPEREALAAWVEAQFAAPPANATQPTDQPLSPRFLWAFPYDTTQPVADIMAAYLETWIVRRYVRVMYRKYRNNGRAPTFLTMNEVGELFYEQSYRTAGPNPNIYKQVADVLCELDLIETNDRNDIQVTGEGRAIVDRLCSEVPCE
ncbi:hypothetical protein GRX01_07840 [Halobaculum sp. WSA2]|uniref:Uncharacterized protein n=1 Tax=Halobaculum saliterrae TaxID=2073113 RepID=A0A6B0SRU3_9EURY|nr:hypothetical protein [Halobaculum saliterrae]MXR41247.1 hypothetical protein [Halobaculum saliterrae]